MIPTLLRLLCPRLRLRIGNALDCESDQLSRQAWFSSTQLVGQQGRRHSGGGGFLAIAGDAKATYDGWSVTLPHHVQSRSAGSHDHRQAKKELNEPGRGPIYPACPALFRFCATNIICGNTIIFTGSFVLGVALSDWEGRWVVGV